jgi:hypothetical protein
MRSVDLPDGMEPVIAEAGSDPGILNRGFPECFSQRIAFQVEMV